MDLDDSNPWNIENYSKTLKGQKVGTQDQSIECEPVEVSTSDIDVQDNPQLYLQNMNEIINLGIPHIGENIFKNCSDQDLIEFRHVSTTWRELSENVLVKRWRDRLIEATCSCGFCFDVKDCSCGFCSNDCSCDCCSNEEQLFICSTIHNLCLQPNEVIQILFDHPGGNDINWNAKDQYGNTIFMSACHTGNIDTVKIMVKSAQNKNIDLNARNVAGGTAFMLACAEGHTNVVEMLLKCALEKDIDLNASCVSSASELTAYMAACKNGHADVVKLLLDHSQTDFIEIDNISSDEGLTGLVYACKNGHTEVVKYILHASRTRRRVYYLSKTKRLYYDIDQPQFKRGLELAHENGHTKIVTLLKKP